MAGSTPASPTASLAPGTAGTAPRTSLGAEAWRRFKRHRLAFVGALVFTLIVLAVAIGPFIWTLPIN
ncbi:MAG TPA: hypothetical protein VIT02_11920, partial [Burkholderiaceae bacterium]